MQPRKAAAEMGVSERVIKVLSAELAAEIEAATGARRAASTSAKAFQVFVSCLFRSSVCAQAVVTLPRLHGPHPTYPTPVSAVDSKHCSLTEWNVEPPATVKLDFMQTCIALQQLWLPPATR